MGGGGEIKGKRSRSWHSVEEELGLATFQHDGENVIKIRSQEKSGTKQM